MVWPAEPQRGGAVMRKFIVGVMGLMLATSVMAGNFSAYYSVWDAGDAGESGIGGGIRMDTDLTDHVGAEMRLSVYNELDDDASDNFIVIPVEMGMFGQLPLAHNRVVVYGGGGIGYYIMPEYEFEDDIDADIEDVFGFYVMAGTRFMFADSAGVFFEAKYTSVEPDEIEYSDRDWTDDLDQDLNGVMVNIGLAFGW
jgi:hypothetical protein